MSLRQELKEAGDKKLAFHLAAFSSSGSIDAEEAKVFEKEVVMFAFWVFTHMVCQTSSG